jgi:spore germination protein YaaH
VAHYALPRGRAAATLRKYARDFDTLALSGFVVDTTGRIRRHQRIHSIRGGLLASEGTRLVPLVTMASNKAGRFLLGQNSRQERFVASARRLHKLGFDHLHLDIEYLRKGYRSGLIRLLRRLRQARPKFKISMALFPQVGFSRKWSALHRPADLAPYLDEAVVMTYDYHRPGTSPGPVTDLIWSQKNIRLFARHMPQDKIWLGVPAYGYRWPLGGGKARALSRRRGDELAQRHGGTRHGSGTVTFDYSRGGKKYRVFFADQKTQEGMAALARRHGLRGIAIWRVGYLF